MSEKGEGYVMIDHRHSEGIPDAMARKIGLTEKEVGAGKLFEAAYLKCSHCLTPYLKNPLRTRERGFCWKCSHYVCDICAEQMTKPEYVHITRDEIIDRVTSGRFTMSGPSHAPIFTPIT